MPMEPPPYGAAGIGLAVEQPHFAEAQSKDSLPSPCCAMLAEGLGTINVTLGSVIGGGLAGDQRHS